MWLRSEKRGGRIIHPNSKSPTNLRKIVKNTISLKTLKQSAATVTLSRRSGLYSTTGATKNGRKFRKNGDAKQSPSNKCNIKNRRGVKRLNKKNKISLSKRQDKKKIEPVAGTSTGIRFRRKSSRTLLEIGKENCWQNQDQLKTFPPESKRCRKQRTGNSHRSTDSVESDASSGSNGDKNNSSRADTFRNCSLQNEICDSCKPSTTCNCSSSSSQIVESQTTSGVSAPRIDCVNYIECDSTTDNDRTNLPSTSLLTSVSPAIPYILNVNLHFQFHLCVKQ